MRVVLDLLGERVGEPNKALRKWAAILGTRQQNRPHRLGRLTRRSQLRGQNAQAHAPSGASLPTSLEASCEPGNHYSAQEMEKRSSRARISMMVRSMSPNRSEEHTSELQSLRHLVCR